MYQVGGSRSGAESDPGARIRARDPAVFEELLRTEGPRLLTTARRLLRQEADAQDALQEAFLHAFRGADRFEERASPGTWLHRIVVNACLMRLRSAKRRPERSIEALLPEYDRSGHHVEGPRAWGQAPDRPLQREELRRTVRDAIDSLPESHRTALLLRDIEGLPNAEVAAALEISPGAAKVRVHRARQALRTLLDATMREGDR